MSNTPRKPVQKVTSTNFGPDNLHLALNLEPYVNASDAANFLGIHPKTLMRLARDGVIRAYSFTEVRDIVGVFSNLSWTSGCDQG